MKVGRDKFRETNLVFLTKKMPLINGRTKYSNAVFALFDEKVNATFVEIDLPQLNNRTKLLARLFCLITMFPSIWIESWYARKDIYDKLSTLGSNDILVLDHFQFWWVLFAKAVRKKPNKIVLLSHNLECANKWSYVKFGKFPINVVAFFEFIGLYIWERIISFRAHAIISINAYEQEVYASWNNSNSVYLIYPYLNNRIAANGHKIQSDSNNVILVGSYGYLAKELNVIWLINVFDKITSKFNNKFNLLIVGRGASDRLISKAKLTQSVTFVGEVDELDKWYHKSLAAIVPERLGGGFKLKIIEAVSFDIPLVIHERALLGSGFEAGVDCIVFKDEIDLHQSLKTLKENPIIGQKLRENAIKKINLLFNKDQALLQIDGLLSSLKSNEF